MVGEDDLHEELAFEIPVLPERPTWRVEHFDNFFENFDLRDAVYTIQDIWMEWSVEVQAILQRMGDRLLVLEISDERMVDLIRIASRYPFKPGIPDEEDYADSILQRKTRTIDKRIHRDWEFWADQIQPLYDGMADTIASCKPAQSGIAAVNDDQGIESVNMESLSISRQALNHSDLRRVLREMLEPSTAPSTEMDAYRQVIAHSNVLFEAKKEADEMTDTEAEAFVNRMDAMHIDD